MFFSYGFPGSLLYLAASALLVALLWRTAVAAATTG
jgi:hypothetical protein